MNKKLILFLMLSSICWSLTIRYEKDCPTIRAWQLADDDYSIIDSVKYVTIEEGSITNGQLDDIYYQDIDDGSYRDDFYLELNESFDRPKYPVSWSIISGDGGTLVTSGRTAVVQSTKDGIVVVRAKSGPRTRQTHLVTRYEHNKIRVITGYEEGSLAKYIYDTISTFIQDKTPSTTTYNIRTGNYVSGCGDLTNRYNSNLFTGMMSYGYRAIPYLSTTYNTWILGGMITDNVLIQCNHAFFPNDTELLFNYNNEYQDSCAVRRKVVSSIYLGSHDIRLVKLQSPYPAVIVKMLDPSDFDGVYFLEGEYNGQSAYHLESAHSDNYWIIYNPISKWVLSYSKSYPSMPVPYFTSETLLGTYSPNIFAEGSPITVSVPKLKFLPPNWRDYLPCYKYDVIDPLFRGGQIMPVIFHTKTLRMAVCIFKFQTGGYARIQPSGGEFFEDWFYQRERGDSGQMIMLPIHNNLVAIGHWITPIDASFYPDHSGDINNAIANRLGLNESVEYVDLSSFKDYSK